MGRHTIPITNGKGSIRLVNGNYKVSAVVEGYDPDSIEPKNVTIVEGTNTYTFTIKANGTLTLHVTDTGNPQTGVQVIISSDRIFPVLSVLTNLAPITCTPVCGFPVSVT